jgi:hypothetical protein
MSLEFLDPNTYTFAGAVPVGKGRDLIIPESIILSQTMLIKWQIRQLVKGATIDQIPPATLSAVLEIPGMGVLDRTDAQIQASQQGKDVVQLWTIDPSLPYKITFSDVSDLVANSVLEFYQSSLSMSTINNPSETTVDMSAVTTAITDAAAAQVAAIQQSSAIENRKVEKIIDDTYTAVVWSSNAENHIALQPDRDILRIVLTNIGTKNVYFDTFMDIGSKASTPQYDSFMAPKGVVTIEGNESSVGVLLYTIGAASSTSDVLISLER